MTADSNRQPHYKELFLQVDGAKLRYRDIGRGPAVLFLHGWTLDLEMWEPQFTDLADSFRLIGLDRRGFGCSTGSPSLSNDISDARLLCQRLGLGTFAVVGMSQGARVALELARVAPESISCLVLDGPPDLWVSGSAAEDELPMAKYRALVREGGAAAFRLEWKEHPLVQLATKDERAHELLRRIISRYPATDLQRACEPQPPITSALAPESITTPTLVVNGELDLQSRRSAAESLALRLPVAEHVLIPAAGHVPNLDHPQTYNRLLRGFLNRHLPPSTTPNSLGSP